jgi:hypothetical protein
MVADDFSHIYFQSEKQLVPEGRPGERNIYALSDGAIHFVATPGAPVLFPSRGSLSADGNVLVFSARGLAVPARTMTSDKIASRCPSLEPGSEFGAPSDCYELYLYDDRARSLECVSCLRGGETTHSWGGIRGPLRGVPGEFDLSADGSTVIFLTAEALVSPDVNKGFDAYEWRNGMQRLLTDGVTEFGEDPFSSPKVAGIDADGSDIFFSVSDPGLTGYEHDGVSNLYDARIGGGFPRPSPPGHCSGDSCQGPLRAAPALDRTGSSTFSGRGNVKEGRPRCSKGKTRRRGRCVKRHGRKHHKRGHAKQGSAK